MILCLDVASATVLSMSNERSQRPKWHLDRFSRFCRAHSRDQQTNRQTDHATPPIGVDRILYNAFDAA